MEVQIDVARRKEHGGKEGEIRWKIRHLHFLHL